MEPAGPKFNVHALRGRLIQGLKDILQIYQIPSFCKEEQEVFVNLLRQHEKEKRKICAPPPPPPPVIRKNVSKKKSLSQVQVQIFLIQTLIFIFIYLLE